MKDKESLNIPDNKILSFYNKDIELFLNWFIEKYKGLLFYEGYKYGMSEDDCLDLFQDILMELVNKDFIYDYRLSSFTTWVSIKIRTRVINYINKNSKKYIVVDINSLDGSFENKNAMYHIRNYRNLLTDLEYDVVLYKIYFNYTFITIGEMFKTNRFNIMRIYNNALDKIRQFEYNNYSEIRKKI